MRDIHDAKKVMKKFIIILLCLSSLGFAKGLLRHRVAVTVPDAPISQAAAQQLMDEMTQTDNPLDQHTVAADFSNAICATIAQDLISAAKSHIGARYRRGSIGPKAFDCSGFTSYVFQRLGISLKRSSQEQHTQGEAITEVSQMLPGDLVFFGRGGKAVNHVGIVTHVNAEDSTFSFIHASTSRGVRIDSSSDAYWTRRFINARRIIGID